MRGLFESKEILEIYFSYRAKKTGLEVIQAFQETGNMAKVFYS